MSKRMTKMEACHYLTMVRDELDGELTRLREREKKNVGDMEPESDMRIWTRARIVEFENKIRAIEMAGVALTR
jgi:hypothetical protein